MTSNQRPIDDRPAHARLDQERETLCALFDGELRDDEARFALKRLGHDVQWRDTVGRWQLYGDALRGQAQGVAASGFADRVALALREEQTQHVAMPLKAAGGRRAWMGGALAASVAVAALFVTRPFSNDAPSTNSPARSPQVASAPAVAAPQVASTPAPTPVIPAGPATPQSPDRTLGMSAAAVAAVEVPRRASERRASRVQNTREQSARSASRVGRAVAQPIIATAGIAQTAVADAVAPITSPITSARRPFQPEHVEPASRPWPRAVLPQYSGNGALTASFGTSSASSQSFYPFEPQNTLPAAEETPAPRDAQD